MTLTLHLFLRSTYIGLMSHDDKGSTPGLHYDLTPAENVGSPPPPHDDQPAERANEKDNAVECAFGHECGPISIAAVDHGAERDAASERAVERTSQGIAGEDEEAEEEEETYPEGGLQAWLVTFGAWCAMIVGLGLVNTIGPIQAYVLEHQLRGYGESNVSWIFSIYVFIVFFCGLQIGPVFDAKGPRLLILAGSVLVTLCMMLLGFCTAYWHFILDFSIIGGLGSSLLFTPAVASISHFFNRRRAAATGLATTGGAIGGIIFPLTLQALIPKVGFAWSTRIVGFIFLALSIVANAFVRSRLAPKRGGSVLPDFTIFVDGTGAFALVTAGTFFMEFGLFVPITYLTSFCVAAGHASLGYQVIAILSAGSAFGRYIPGLLADRIGRFNTMIIMLGVCIVTTFGLWMPAADFGDATTGLIIAYAVLFGFASGSNISLTPTCVGQLCKTQVYGRYYATCYTVVSFSTLTGIPIAGALIVAANGSFWGLILFTGLSYVLSLACFVAVRVRRVGWRIDARW